MTVERPRLAPPPYASLHPGVWRVETPIRFSHCDPAGLVYFARYFDILNGVVEDWFSAALGLSYAEFIGPRRIGLGYAGLAADFVQPGFMGDRMTVAVLLGRTGASSIALQLPFYRDGEPILMAAVTIVTTSLTEHRAIPVPDDLRSALARYEDHCR